MCFIYSEKDKLRKIDLVSGIQDCGIWKTPTFLVFIGFEKLNKTIDQVRFKTN